MFSYYYFLVSLVTGYYDPALLVPMSAYAKNYRTLSCYECFQAQGKMCHYKTDESMIAITGSSNIYHGLCCKPDYSGEFCTTKDKMYCS